MITRAQRIRPSDVGFGIIIISFFLVVLSYPMPPKIGAVEITMGIGLTIGSLLLGLTLVTQEIRDLKLFVLCVSYFLLAPLLMGVLHSNNLSNVARDVAPLMFMVVIPLLIILLPQGRNTPYRLRALLVAILAVGLVSVLQFHSAVVQQLGSMNAFISGYGSNLVTPDNVLLNKLIGFMLRLVALDQTDISMLIIKCQDPAILFTAIYLLCIGLVFVLIKPRKFLLGLLALGGGGFCAYGFSAVGLRAFSGLSVLALIIFALHLIRSKKLPVWHLIVTGILGLSLTYAHVIQLFSHMWAKQQLVGLQGRPAELYAVFNTISENFITLFFGIGWGGVLVNPILGGNTTRFTHSLISYWLLKTGIVGFAVMVLFLALLLRRINLKGVWASSHRLAIFLAASAAIIIGLFFEPTYKMLSFGLIVGLLLAELSSTSGPPQEQMPNNSLLRPHADKL